MAGGGAEVGDNRRDQVRDCKSLKDSLIKGCFLYQSVPIWVWDYSHMVSLHRNKTSQSLTANTSDVHPTSVRNTG